MVSVVGEDVVGGGTVDDEGGGGDENSSERLVAVLRTSIHLKLELNRNKHQTIHATSQNFKVCLCLKLAKVLLETLTFFKKKLSTRQWLSFCCCTRRTFFGLSGFGARRERKLDKASLAFTR